MSLLRKLAAWFGHRSESVQIRHGRVGELAARKYLEQKGLKFLTANFRTRRGEIDLIFRAREEAGWGHFFSRNETDCLVFVEVKARSSERWGRPASAVNPRKRRILSRTALRYVRSLEQPRVRIRFDVVEVLLADNAVREIRHLPNTFSLSAPYRYG